MKKCKECKKEVPNTQWAYKDNLCISCNNKKRYAEKHPDYKEELTELNKLTKDELIKRIMGYKGIRGNINTLFAQKNYQIRNFRLRLTKIRNEIDYLLHYPYSSDNSSKTRPHKRDKGQKPNERFKYNLINVIKVKVIIWLQRWLMLMRKSGAYLGNGALQMTPQ